MRSDLTTDDDISFHPEEYSDKYDSKSEPNVEVDGDSADDNDEEDMYYQIYFRGIKHEVLYKPEIDPVMKETHVTSRTAIVLLLVAAALLFCFSVSGLLQALAYKGATEQPVSSTTDDFYHLYGYDGKFPEFGWDEVSQERSPFLEGMSLERTWLTLPRNHDFKQLQVLQ